MLKTPLWLVRIYVHSTVHCTYFPVRTLRFSTDSRYELTGQLEKKRNKLTCSLHNKNLNIFVGKQLTQMLKAKNKAVHVFVISMRWVNQSCWTPMNRLLVAVVPIIYWAQLAPFVPVMCQVNMNSTSFPVHANNNRHMEKMLSNVPTYMSILVFSVLQRVGNIAIFANL